MRVKLSNGNWLAVDDNIDQKVLQAQIELAEEEIAERTRIETAEKELEIPKIKRGR